MKFNEKIKQLRKQEGISQTDIAKIIGVAKSTYSLYESGKREPDVEKIKAIAKALNTTGNELLGITYNDYQKSEFILSSNEQIHIKKYRTLDEHGKDMVDTVLEKELDRIAQATQSHQDIIQLFPINEYLQPASAGTGQYLDDSSFEVLNLVKQPPRGASYIVRVQGDSMEPTYSDGDRVFVGTTYEVGIGDIGLFWSDGNIYIKERGENGLISHNSDYNMLVCNEYKDVRTLGKVIGKCTDDYLGE